MPMHTPAERAKGAAPAKLSPDEVNARVDAAGENIAASRQEQIAIDIPPASEPLEPRRINTLSAIVGDAMATLMGPQAPKLPMPQVTEPLESIPPALFAVLSAFSAMAEQHPDPAFDRYEFDPVQLSADNSGLAEMANIVSNMAQDKKIQQLMQEPFETSEMTAGGEAEAPTELAAEEDNLEDLV